MFVERRAATLVKRESFAGGWYRTRDTFLWKGNVNEIANHASHHANSRTRWNSKQFRSKILRVLGDAFWSQAFGIFGHFDF